MQMGKYNGLNINEETLAVIGTMAEGLPGGFFIYHADGKEEFIYINSQMVRIMGCTTEAEFRMLTQNSFKGLVHSEDLDAVEESIQRQIHRNSDMIDRVTYRITRADGKILWIDETGQFVHTEVYGDIFYVFVISATNEHDYKIQKRMELQLKMVDALCCDYLNVYLVDMRKKSVEAVKMDGYLTPGHSKDGEIPYDYDTLWSMYIKERVHPEDADMLADAVRIEKLKEILDSDGKYSITYRILENKKPHYYQAKFTRVDKNDRNDDIIIVSFQNMDTVIGKELADARELENAKNALEAALDEAVRSKLFAERFLDTFDSAYYVDIPGNTCIIYRQQEYQIRDYTETADDFFGFARRYVENGVAEEDRERLAFICCPEGIRKWVREHDDRNDSTVQFTDISIGYRRYMHLCILSGEDEDHVQIGINDVDKRIRRQKAQEKVLEQALNAADSANKAKTNFFFNMSHDIRTPMNAIIGFADLLSKYEEDGERRKDYIRKIQESSRYLLELINNVLEMARIESGKMTLDESFSNVEELYNSFETIFLEQIRKKKIHFMKKTDVHCRNIVCDSTKVKQVFVNLISNAIKYTPEGGSVTMRLTELPSEREGYAVLKTVIEDTGIGMSADFLPHIFEDFSREKNSTQSRVIGTGLGMHIVKKMVDLMGGSIEIESEPGKGTKITVILSHKITDDANGKKYHESGNVFEKKEFEGKRILLAEDNELNAEIAVEILTDAGFEVAHAEDGVICIDMLQKAEPGYYDLILMDIQMPNMDGYKAASEIRKLSTDRRNIPIIAMTANAFEEDRQNALAVGMNGHISKPIEIPKLLAVLAGVLKPCDSKEFPQE